jgi:predicted phosphohydrolase
MMLSLSGQSIFAFSDTHGNHRRLQVPEDADIVICAGDAVEDDLKGGEYDGFIAWFSSLPAKWKIFVPGNHELSFDLGQADDIIKQFEAAGITVLQDAVEDCDGVIIGSISGNARIADEDIPNDLDILVTHYPPYGILDENLGSPEILNFVLKAKPKWHLFGHVHETEGQQFQLGETICQNVSVFNSLSQLLS